MKKAITALALLLMTTGYGQNTFVKKYNSDFPFVNAGFGKIINTHDKGIIALGSDTTLALLKLDAIGNIEWMKKYALVPSSYAHWADVVQLNDSCFVLLFNVLILGETIYGLLNIDEFGNIRWVKYNSIPGTNPASSMCKTDDGGFVIAGGGCSGENYAVKYSSSGEILWQNEYTIPGTYGFGTSIIQSVAGDLLMVSRVRNGMSLNMDIGLLRIHPQGKLKWFKRYGGNEWDEPGHLAEMTDGSIVICGVTRSYSSGRCGFMMRTDGAGNQIWFKTLQAGKESALWDMASTPSNEYVAVGSSGNAGLTIKMNVDGKVIWARTTGVSSNSIINDGADGYYVAGGTEYYHSMLAGIDDNGGGYCQSDVALPYAPNVRNALPDATAYTLPVHFVMGPAGFMINDCSYDGTLLCSSPFLSVQEIDEEIISIYPNPAVSFINVNYESKNSNVQFEISDITGKKCQGSSLETQIGIGQLSPGLYLLRITDGNHRVTKRFVKE